MFPHSNCLSIAIPTALSDLKLSLISFLPQHLSCGGYLMITVFPRKPSLLGFNNLSFFSSTFFGRIPHYENLGSRVLHWCVPLCRRLFLPHQIDPSFFAPSSWWGSEEWGFFVLLNGPAARYVEEVGPLFFPSPSIPASLFLLTSPSTARNFFLMLLDVWHIFPLFPLRSMFENIHKPTRTHGWFLFSNEAVTKFFCVFGRKVPCYFSLAASRQLPVFSLFCSLNCFSWLDVALMHLRPLSISFNKYARAYRSCFQSQEVCFPL